MKHSSHSAESLDEFFASGYEETENPFITESSRKWGKYVALTGAISAACLLFLAYITGFFSENLSLALLVIVYFLAGTPALIDSIEDLADLNINIEVLMTLAALLSVLIGSQMEGALLLVLFSLSEALEETVTKKTKGALNTLHKLSPSIAHVIDKGGEIYPKSVREVDRGMKILIKAGEIVPLDGTVIQGSSYLDLSHLTGESIPVSKSVGDEVQAGSLNTDGSLTIVVNKTSGESTLAKIIHLITQAQQSKPKLQRFLDRFGKTYATTVILLAIFFGATLPFFFSIPYLTPEGSIYRSLAFLIAASPCALIIATPTAYLSAISACARRGILLKGGVVLDAIARCQMLAFDKTGTLTSGRLRTAKVEQDGADVNENRAISIAAALERIAVHPIAEAVCRYASEKKLKFAKIDNAKVLPGKGVEGWVQLGKSPEKVVIGNADFILSLLKSDERKQAIRKKITQSGHVVALLLIRETLVIFHFLDEVRTGVKELVNGLKDQLELTMLTGDHIDNADLVAKELGIDHVYADLQPEDKLRLISDFSVNKQIMMVGDGINDGPALTRSNVGVAMGQVGSQTAINAADVVLLRDELAIISWLVKQAKKTTFLVKENLFLALLAIFVNVVFSLIGVFPLWLAVVLHEGSTVLVGLNSLRLLR